MSLADYEAKFARLTLGRIGAREQLHKPALLLALLDLFAQRTIKLNCFPYAPELLELFGQYFEAVRDPLDPPAPIIAFFHLREDGFWHHRARQGHEALVEGLKASPGVKAFLAVCDYAYLDDELFLLLQERDHRADLREILITTYFSLWRKRIAALVEKEARIANYQRQLDDGERLPDGASLPEYIRETAFNRIVRRAYNYRCAACGLRVVMEGGLYIVDAAHLIPYEVSRDDDPRNGIALCKNHYWAMEQNLIAPGGDRVWRVLKALDDRLEGQRELIHLDGRALLLPHLPRYQPKEASLQWREYKLASLEKLDPKPES